MKTLNELLETRVSLEERVSEILDLCPNLLEGEKVSYDKNAYIRYDSNSGYLFTGVDGRKGESLVNMAFPCIFYLSGIYLAKDLATKYEKSDAMQRDHSLSINEDGLMVLSGYGVVGNESIYRSIIDEHKEDEDAVSETLSAIEETIANE